MHDPDRPHKMHHMAVAPKKPTRYPTRIAVDFDTQSYAHLERLSSGMGIKKVDVVRLAVKYYIRKGNSCPTPT